MKLLSGIERIFKTFLPTPFTIAILITVFTFILAFFLTDSDVDAGARGMELVGFWYDGLWKSSLLAFAVQMMLMLVLGHALALTKPADRFMSAMTRFCNDTPTSAFVVTLLTILVSLFNWGLGLIFGAILARKVGERAGEKNIQLNYALIGAAGYSGLMVWHGGISGSAPIKAAESGHISSLMEGVLSSEQMAQLPESVPFSETIFGTMNLTVMLALVVCVPLFMYWLGKRSKKAGALPKVKMNTVVESDSEEGKNLDNSPTFSRLAGALLCAFSIYMLVIMMFKPGMGINPNFINFTLFGLCLLLHSNINSFLAAIDQAIRGAAGILIQFPLYFGIMGLMIGSGLIQVFSDFFVDISTEISFPIYSFISAGIVNVFVPSGGGQWGVQGPIIIQSAMELGVSLPKSIMALSYGDQLTNMLQPFWALPLLGITGLKAKSILPYTLLMMILGAIIYLAALFIF
ncbi:MAG: short-chain fatty acid transporter [Crocinitomicaceae bacterium]